MGRGAWIGFRLDLQTRRTARIQRENGVDSRSQNILYFRPTLVFGHDDKVQLTLQPRVWGLHRRPQRQSPDIDEYRGYFDLRAVIGWRRVCNSLPSDAWATKATIPACIGPDLSHHENPGSFSVYL